MNGFIQMDSGGVKHFLGPNIWTFGHVKKHLMFANLWQEGSRLSKILNSD